MTQTREDLAAPAVWLRFTVRLVLLAPLDGLSLMLLVGIVHHEWWPQVPTIGYWWAILVGILWRGFNTPMKSPEEK